MASSWSYGLAFLVFFSFNFQLSSALPQAYCSDLNTASTPGNYSQYQSNGLCYNFCLSDYAFAVLKGADCYCSDYIPGSTTSNDDCNIPCPGYPDDLCGNDGSGLYAYISLPNHQASGTEGGSSSTPSSTPQSPSSTDPPKPTSKPTSSTSSSSTKDTTSSSSTWTPTPVVSVFTTTGEVRTVTVTPTVPPNSQNLAPISEKKSSGKGLSTGAAVGLTVGLVALVAIISAIIYFCVRRRQKERQRALEEAEESRRGSTAGLGGPIPSRTMSENSRYVLNTDGRQVVESYEGDQPGSRRSRLVPVDPRLNPHAPLYQRGENKSRESVNTINDHQDYSRRVHQQGPILRATNPDD